MTRAIFYDRIRDSLFGGSLSQGQVDGFEVLLDAWAKDHAGKDKKWLAYCLATAKHETANTMQPIEEYGGDARAERLYGPNGLNPTRAKRMGNTEPGDGAKYKGRGFVQLTWKNNYRRAGDTVGLDLVAKPLYALRPDIAARILYQGCIEGWFTGKALGDYIGQGEVDYKNARRVVNGTDKATTIARYAEKFERALDGVDVGNTMPPVPIPDDPGPVEPEQKHWLVRLVIGLLKAFRNVGR